MRVGATIIVMLLVLGGCGGSRQAEPARPADVASAAVAPSCAPWPDRAGLPQDSAVLRSAEQELPSTRGAFSTPVSSTVGYACVGLFASRGVEQAYCGAAEPGGALQECQIGQECAIGSIMVTELAVVPGAGGPQLCATFENWSPLHPRTVILAVKPR